MWKRKRRRYILGLTLIAMSFLSGCARECYEFCPAYPVAGASVAAELEKMNYSKFPNTWEWIGRIDKLRQELDLCR